MPAFRWHSSFNELFQWIGENDDELLALLMPSVFSQFPKKDSKKLQQKSRKNPKI